MRKKIDADIEKNRKADAVVNLGEAAPGGDVKVEQLKHDFIFGAHIFNFNQLGAHEYNERYKRAYGELFNSATVPFYWSDFEMQPGRPRFVEEYRGILEQVQEPERPAPLAATGDRPDSGILQQKRHTRARASSRMDWVFRVVDIP